VTFDAPPAAFASVALRGYTPGEYLGEYVSSLEAEERYRLGERWTATLFGGVAALYGDTPNPAGGSNLYPAIGGGVQYLLKPQAGVVLNLEFAQGADGSYGLYLKIGYGF
jgi:hypothetical protein